MEIRPRLNANALVRIFGRRAASFRHLDYGGGTGLCAKMLRESKWDSTSYDPFLDEGLPIEQLGKFDLITAVEVFEHVPDVNELMSNLKSLLAKDGLILFSTQLSDGNIHFRQRLNWWYAAPRNGHVSLFSTKSLLALAQKYGFNCSPSPNMFHVLYATLPPWADLAFINEITCASIFPPPEQSSRGDSDSQAAQAHVQAGTTHHQAGRLDEARAEYLRALEQEPANSEALALLGLVERARGNLQRTVEYLTQAIAANGAWWSYHNDLGEALLQLGRFDEAASALRRAAELDPQAFQPHLLLGVAADRQKRHAEAIEEFEQSVCLQPDVPHAWLLLAAACFAVGKLDRAEQASRRALALQPRYPEAEHQLRLIMVARGAGKID